MATLTASNPGFIAVLVLAIITLLLCLGAGAAAINASAEPLNCTELVDAIQQNATLAQVIREVDSAWMEQFQDCLSTSGTEQCNLIPPLDLFARFRTICEEDMASFFVGFSVRWDCRNSLSGALHDLMAHYVRCLARSCSEPYIDAAVQDQVDAETERLLSILPNNTVCWYNQSEVGRDSSNAGAPVKGLTVSGILIGCLSSVVMLRGHT